MSPANLAVLKSWSTPALAALPNAFTPNEIQDILRLGQQANSTEARLGDASTRHDIRTCRVSWLSNTSQLPWLWERVVSVMKQLNQQHYRYDLNMLETLQFTHYDSERQEFYGPHMDTVFGVDSAMTPRKLSVVVQLTDPDNYQGGELVIETGAGSITAPREAGTMIVFPSFLWHQVNPVSQGQRFSLVTWAHGPRFR